MAAASHSQERPRAARIRWDRIGRVAMLIVLAALLWLTISPIRSLITELHLSAQRDVERHQLERTAHQLAVQTRALSQASTSATEARNLGYVRAGEHEFAISGLPGN